VDIKQQNVESYHELYAGRHRGAAFEAVNKARIVCSLVGDAGIRPGARVLDVGFGWGTALEVLQRQGYHTHGVEITPRAVAAARGLLPSSILLVSDATALPFPDSYFDVVVCSHVLEHLADDRAAIAELIRVLRSPGWAVIGVPGPGMASHPLHFRNYDLTSLAEVVAPLRVVKAQQRTGALYKLAGRAAVEANENGRISASSGRMRTLARPIANAALRMLAPIDDLLAKRDERPEEVWTLAIKP
jgi:2-polyprenyl-3-methyl-5-hydroxy-6-metoxy-1,4-benzoquinol methylase